jgi:hypothetical protein
MNSKLRKAPGVEKMSDSFTKMSEMCMAMMEKEKAMMPARFLNPARE